MNQESREVVPVLTISFIQEKIILDDLNALFSFDSINVFLTQSTHYLTLE